MGPLKQSVKDENEYNQICKNSKLSSFIRGLINIVNSNPAILNKNYIGTSATADRAAYERNFDGWIQRKNRYLIFA